MTSLDIKILGTGCPNCRRLEAVTRQVVTEMQMTATVSLVKDIQDIVRYGVMATPALVVNGAVKGVGVLPKDRVVTILTTELARLGA